MNSDLRRNADLIGRMSLGDGFADKNAGIGGAPDGGFQPNPDADPADVAKAWREVARHLTPGDWAAICNAAGVPESTLLPLRSREDPGIGK
jgi:hypothetical protein